MKISELIEKLNLEVITDKNFNNRDITGCYIGDLLSRVMSHAESGNIWITIMTNINITAVASLTDAACIILAENAEISKEVTDKANENDIVILRSEKTAYEIALCVGSVLS